MDAKELMIGDWVLCPDNMQRQVRYLQVRPSVIGIGGSSYDEDEIQPIPLTPEILKKNGFENDFYHDECVADYHFVRLEGYSYREDFILVTWCNGELNVVNDLIGEVEIHCENVHELQHALKLCGINKEIEI